MYFEEPKAEFVTIDLNESITTTASVPCTVDGHSGQGGTSCVGNAEHAHGGGCDDTAPIIM